MSEALQKLLRKPLEPPKRLIAERLLERKISMAEASRALKQSHSYIQQYLSRGIPKELSEDVREKLARILLVDPDALRKRPKKMQTAQAAVNHVVEQTLNEHVDPWREPEAPASIPEIDVHAGAAYGGGFAQEKISTDSKGYLVSEDAVRARWGIPLPFLSQELRARPDRVHILPVRGDSMEPTLFDGDRVIIDLDDRDISQGGIFALLDDLGSPIVKQVELVRGMPASEPRRIVCRSRNPAYAPFPLPLVEPVAIIGRVAAKITRI